MDEGKQTCVDCNGKGLVSTGADKLDLGTGKTITCATCDGTGKVESANVSNVDNSDGPKAQGETAEGTGEGSGAPSETDVKVPQIGDPCELEDGSIGVLDKDEAGAWVCKPKPSAE